MSAALGATAQDWAAWEKLGLTADLLPVVSNTSRMVSKGSHLYYNRDSLGKVPSLLTQAGEITGILGWSRHQATPKQVAKWAEQPDYGICIVGRRVKAIDIDVGDPAQAAAIREMFVMLLGELPMRFRSNSGKCLLAVRLEGDMPKRKFATSEGFVELLGQSQEFMIAGTHPSGARYEWEGGVPAEIPTVSADDLIEAWDTVYKAIGTPGTSTAERRTGGQEKARTAADSDDPAVPYMEGGGWVREYLDDGSLHVVCAWQHEHTDGAAGAASSTRYFPAGVGAQKRGFKCLHGHCTGRTNFDFLRAIGYEAEEIVAEFDIVPVPPPKPAPKLRRMKPFVSNENQPGNPSANGKLEVNATLVAAYLDRPDLCGARLAFDQFRLRQMVCWQHAPNVWKDLEKRDVYDLRIRLEHYGFTKLSEKAVEDGISYVADLNAFDSAIDWVSGLEWDGKPRAEEFFIRYWGAADTPYTRAVGRYLWSALAARALDPGCQVEMVPTLIGGQGLRKTSGVRAIAPDVKMFVGLKFGTPDKEQAYKIFGKLVGELGELQGMSNRDVEDVKQWLTGREEEIRLPFERRNTIFPRRIVLLGTGNRKAILIDETGNRRWLPMEVTKVDAEGIARDRNELWAEGRHIYCANGHAPEWEAAERLADEVHTEFEVIDVWQDDVARWLDSEANADFEGPSSGVRNGDLPLTTADVLVGALRSDVAKISLADQRRIGRVLRRLGYESGSVRVAGVVATRWTRKKSHED